MALATSKYCPKCGDETVHINMLCARCEDRFMREEQARWEALSTEEKIQDLIRRIEKLERGRL